MTAAQSQDHHQVSAIGAPASGRRLLRMAALVVIAAICLWAAAALIGSAIQTLHSSTAGAGVDAGAGSGGAAARREAITSAVTMGALAVLVAALTEIVLPRPLGLLRGVGNRRFVGGALGATAGYNRAAAVHRPVRFHRCSGPTPGPPSQIPPCSAATSSSQVRPG